MVECVCKHAEILDLIGVHEEEIGQGAVRYPTRQIDGRIGGIEEGSILEHGCNVERHDCLC